MKISGVGRSATVAWGASSEHADLLAAGTVAGAISDNFDSSAHLEVFKLDMTSRTGELSLLGSVSSSERFHRLAWGTKGMENGTMPYGMLAGGMVDGSIKIYSPATLMAGEGADPLVASIERHQGAVRGLEFNPSVSNLLASGAGESDVFITDLSNPSSPSVYSPGAKSSGPPADISSVAWNRKVQHILASTSHSGLSVVWDLKLKKPVISFQDPNNKTQRNSVVSWNPEAATEVLVASADDRSPVLQIWDLRNATMPVRALHGHTKGILAASWCAHDANLLLSSGNDSRTICWDVCTGEMVCELPSTTRPTFDVQWSPRLPAILSASSFDGIVSVYSLQDASSVPTPASAEGFLPQQSNLSRPVRAPKWLKRPCGATFGFGGQLSLFNEAAGVSVSTVDVVSDAAVVERSQQLEQALEQGGEGLGGFCAAKAAGTTSARDATEWRLMQVLCSSEQRRLLLSFLGCSFLCGLLFGGSDGGFGFGFLGIVTRARCQKECCKHEAYPLGVKR